MPDTRITKERLKNHWVYSSWKYLLLLIICIAGWNLIYSITEYQPPREKRLEVYFLSTSYVEENISALADELAPLFVGEEEGDMEEVNFFAVNYGADDDVYGPQLLMTRLASHEGDIYMVNEETLSTFIAQELAMPLDEYIQSGALDVTGQDLETVTRAAPIGEDENGYTVYGSERHVYALPAATMYGFVNENIITNTGMYFVVMSYTDKVDTCIELLNLFSERFTAEMPDWMREQEEQRRREIENLPTELTVDSLAAQATAEPAEEDGEASEAADGEADMLFEPTSAPEPSAAPETSAPPDGGE